MEEEKESRIILEKGIIISIFLFIFFFLAYQKIEEEKVPL
jgi:hypothetical protein